MPRSYPSPDYEIQDLINFAMETRGLEYDDAYELVSCWEVDAPEWDVTYYEYELDELEASDWTPEESVEVLREFMIENGHTSIVILK